MKELKCPNCGSVFTVDESDYADILNQVKTAEFNAEIDRRIKELKEQQLIQRQADELKAQQSLQTLKSAKDLELEQKRTEIARLQEQMKMMEQAKQLEFKEQMAAKEAEIAGLKATIAEGDAKVKVAVLEEQNKSHGELQDMKQQIVELQGQLASKDSEAKIRELGLKEKYEGQLKEKQDLIDYYKEFKARLSTKMVGESLEVHCSTLFNTTIRTWLPNATFCKDNDSSQGSKGDFIFRDKDGDFEYLSIMFEMKNETDSTGKKHKNEDFLKKLDEDRRNKGCEYAVLVSLLEPDNEYYNSGIVDVSYLYEKMYVIRPQFFIPMITLLVQMSRKNLDLRRELALARSQSIDVTNFEDKLNTFKESFGKNVRLASERFKEAIKEIDDTITHLMKVKDNLIRSDKNLLIANGKAEDLTIRKLTYMNPTMKAKFEEARKNADSKEESEQD